MATIENHGEMSEVMENGDVNVFYPKTYSSDVLIDNDGTNLATLISQLFLEVHPIGCIYMTVDSTNPGTTYGGTWVSWGTGQVPVGVNANDTSFNTVEKTGGEKTHTLTGAESGQKNLGNLYTNTVDINHYHAFSGTTSGQSVDHSHGFTTSNNGSHSHTASVALVSNGGTSWAHDNGIHRGYTDMGNKTVVNSNGGHTHSGTTGGVSANHTHTYSGNTGWMHANNQHNHYTTISASNATNAHNNLQPYITCYMFKRTA